MKPSTTPIPTRPFATPSPAFYLCCLEYHLEHLPPSASLLPKAPLHLIKVSPHMPAPCAPMPAPWRGPTRAQAHSRSAGGSSRAGQSQGAGSTGGAGQALTFTLLTPGAATAITEARILVGRREAGRGPRVLVGVALTQGPGCRWVGQRGQGVLIRGSTGATVEVQSCEIWQVGNIR